jgi:hypothetical protein
MKPRLAQQGEPGTVAEHAGYCVRPGHDLEAAEQGRAYDCDADRGAEAL